MEFSHLLLLLLLLLLLFFSTTSHSKPVYSRYADCAPTSYVCGDANFTVGYPFRVDGRRDYCGYPNFYLGCPSNDSSTLTITVSNKNLHVTSIDYENRLLHLVDTAFVSQSCPQPYVNTTVDASLFRVSDRTVNLTLFINCTASSSSIPAIYDMLCLLSVTGQHAYYRLDNGTMDDVLGRCSSTFVVPMGQDAATRMVNGDLGFGQALQEGFSVNWLSGTGWCGGCVSSGGRCGFNSSAPGDHTCYCSNGTFIGSCYPTPRSGKKGSGAWKYILGVLVLVLGLLLLCALCLLCYRRRSKQRLHSSTLLGPISSVSTPSPKKDIESMSFHCHTHLFSYQELEEATMGFDRSQEIGDGGYGSVYKGVLRDGRVIAVKRLYETNNNDKRVQQFVNEVEILSRVRHPNLVTLYGCTSPKSPHLLLVYEFVPNGTLADHLHDPLRSRSLSLPLRLSMAVDAASALFYLHSIDIIHRDVKTHNILVDQNYNVKIADFGLSRLFLENATHVSTLPQGTPGYLDPEYHRFYKLTDKSDVYSYGVVLMELLSSRPAVDVGKHPSEVSLGMMAVEKIPKGELDFVDPALTDSCNQEADSAAAVARVAELAFRCLQVDREMRPSIKEVLEELRDVSRLLCSTGSAEADGELKVRDDVSLLKDATPFSPNSVIHNWMSASTTLTASK